ncbi:MAG TPA: hypothetical protein VK776_19280 [Bryobacteraceae bacterium]|nr:hypothetical protein [Bryobacteraceae bacterium]
MKFFSAIDLLTNLTNLPTVAEWTLLPALKGGAIAALQSLSKTMQSADFLSVAGLTESVTIAGEFAALAAAAENPVLFGNGPFRDSYRCGRSPDV